MSDIEDIKRILTTAKQAFTVSAAADWLEMPAGTQVLFVAHKDYDPEDPAFDEDEAGVAFYFDASGKLLSAVPTGCTYDCSVCHG